MEEALDLCADEDDERTPVEPVELDTNTAVNSHGTCGCPDARAWHCSGNADTATASTAEGLLCGRPKEKG